MYPKLKQNCYLAGKENNYRMKSQKGYRKNKNDLHVLHPTQAEGNGKIEMCTGMMDNMSCPEEANTMRDVMCPITAKIKNDIAGDKRPPV
jgi:hypothetical protein